MLALPASALLVSQLLDAHQAEAKRLDKAEIAKAGQDVYKRQPEYYEKSADAGQHVQQLAHSSAGYPIQAVEIRAESEDLPPAFRLYADHPLIQVDHLGRHLVRQILLYSDEPSNCLLYTSRERFERFNRKFFCGK